MTQVISKLSNELWLIICSYFDNLKYFVRLWIASNGRKILPADHPTFWAALVREFCLERGVSFDDLKDRLCLENLEGASMVAALFSNRKCSRSGCYQVFQEWCNAASSCAYHSGRLRSTGSLSCCSRKGFKSAGCKSGYHDGLFYKMVTLRRIVHNGIEDESQTSDSLKGAENGEDKTIGMVHSAPGFPIGSKPGQLKSKIKTTAVTSLDEPSSNLPPINSSSRLSRVVAYESAAGDCHAAKRSMGGFSNNSSSSNTNIYLPAITPDRGGNFRDQPVETKGKEAPLG